MTTNEKILAELTEIRHILVSFFSALSAAPMIGRRMQEEFNKYTRAAEARRAKDG